MRGGEVECGVAEVDAGWGGVDPGDVCYGDVCGGDSELGVVRVGGMGSLRMGMGMGMGGREGEKGRGRGNGE